MIDIKSFWRSAKIESHKLTKKLLAGELPLHTKYCPIEDGFNDEGDPIKVPSGIFMVSVDNPDKGVTPGKVSMLSVRLAGQRIVERTHQIASDAEIKKYLADQIEQKKRHDRLDAKANTQRTRVVQGEEPLPAHLQQAQEEDLAPAGKK